MWCDGNEQVVAAFQTTWDAYVFFQTKFEICQVDFWIWRAVTIATFEKKKSYFESLTEAKLKMET